MTDEEFLNGLSWTSLRPVEFDELMRLARRGAATQWGPIENLADLPLRASYLGGWKDEQGKIRPGSIFQKYTQNPNRHSFISHFIPLAALDQTP